MLILSSDPASVVAFTVGPIAVRWYGLCYGLSLILILIAAHLLNAKTKALPREVLEDSLLFSFLGALVGGRLGYVFWYGVDFWRVDSWFPLRVWEGGMSFHGGLLGGLLALTLVSYYHQVKLLSITDFLAPLAPIGLFLGRIGNFINQELYGVVTKVRWAVRFPLVDQELRHPSQLYEAGCEGLLLGIILILSYARLKPRQGKLTGLFLWLYGCMRIVCEVFREPDWQIGYLWGKLTMGTLLTLPMIVLGSWLWFRNNTRD